MMANNNQPASEWSGRGDVRAESGGALGRERARGAPYHRMGHRKEWQKKFNMKNTTALNGRRLIILHTTTNQKQVAATEGSMKGR